MPVEIRVPPLGESVVEATVGRWLKHEGDAIAPGEALVELETDKVNMEVNADAPGVLQRILHPEGDTVGVNEVLAVLAEAGAVPQPERPAAPVAAAAPAAPVEQGNGRPAPAASPVARQMAADKGIDLAEVSGSGVGGKITKEDVESYL
ncbi:MAG TPA: biotin/lipoyl-containing protein, partial [Chthonomonadaceae bacterium]|nr:biotin/lipoyl-containing protein [Chthonomonadaceae bacterium]